MDYACFLGHVLSVKVSSVFQKQAAVRLTSDSTPTDVPACQCQRHTRCLQQYELCRAILNGSHNAYNAALYTTITEQLLCELERRLCDDSLEQLDDVMDLTSSRQRVCVTHTQSVALHSATAIHVLQCICESCLLHATI